MTRIEAIVINRNRRPTVVRVKKGKSVFTIGEDREYHLDPDCAVFGKWRILGVFPMDCNRYYFLENLPRPINPYALMQQVNDQSETVTVEGKQLAVPMHSMCIRPTELAQIFKPRFYQIISRVRDPKQDLMFYGIVGTFILSAYIAWKVVQMTGLMEQIVAWIAQQTGAV